MTGRERIQRMWRGEAVDRSGFWLGMPHADTMPIYLDYFGAKDRLDLAVKLGEDLFWIMCDGAYHAPGDAPMFDYFGGAAYYADSQERVLTHATCVADVDKIPWPNADYLDLDEIGAWLDAVEPTGMSIFGGMWCCFFHIVADYFGMEEYFVKMYEHPEVVHAATQRIVDFYAAANRRIFERYGKRFDACFMGNDFGTQLACIVSPTLFRTFVLPYFKQLFDLAHEFDLPVMIHSCGAIAELLPDLIDAGINGLHPLQAKAAGMEAENLVRIAEDRLVWLGGVDTQELLPFGTPDAVYDEVVRIRRIFGDKLIVSPSHEALLPNVPPQNVESMVKASMMTDIG